MDFDMASLIMTASAVTSAVYTSGHGFTWTELFDGGAIPTIALRM